jgi:hypothetical protein
MQQWVVEQVSIISRRGFQIAALMWGLLSSMPLHLQLV